MDLGLLDHPIGALIMTATIVDDLVNWTLFAIILSDIAPVGPSADAALLIKVGAVLLGAKAAGMALDREAWAIGFGLNARGATGIILAGVGLSNGVIDERVFVAITVMAMVTSLMSGPLMNQLLAKHWQIRTRVPATD
jgi:Kef-type K+ transport system membrane component KefB